MVPQCNISWTKPNGATAINNVRLSLAFSNVGIVHEEDDWKYIELITITIDSLNSEVSKQLLVSVQRANVGVCMMYAIER